MTRRSDTFHQIEESVLLAIIRAPSVDLAIRAARAIHAGGIRVLEITMSVPDALAGVTQLARELGDQAVIGAGTVLNADTARRCVTAGARFVVSPIVDPGVIEATHALDAVAIPGALSPTEIVTAARTGVDCVKVFPCSAVGGPSYLRALHAPLPHVKLLATGGVHLENAVQYLQAGATLLGLGAGLLDLARLDREGEQALVGQARRFVAALHNGR